MLSNLVVREARRVVEPDVVGIRGLQLGPDRGRLLVSPGTEVELGDVRSRVRLPAPTELDRALVQRDRVVVATLPVVLAGEVGVALGHPEIAGVWQLGQLVEDRPRHVEVAVLQSLLEGHAD